MELADFFDDAKIVLVHSHDLPGALAALPARDGACHDVDIALPAIPLPAIHAE